MVDQLVHSQMDCAITAEVIWIAWHGDQALLLVDNTA